MRIRAMSFILAATAVVALCFVILAPMSAPAGAQAKAPASAAFDPHDISGYWQFFNNIKGQGIYATPSKEGPPGFTAWGKQQFDANKPSYGPRMVQFDNDPITKCRPTGIPRVEMYPQPFEFVQINGRTMQFFEREHERRDIWTDGRAHPKDVEPTWMGHAIGKWDGDTFVVDSIGFNDRTWLDFYGDPRSEKLHLIERFKRVDATTLSWQFTVDDPGSYTGLWQSAFMEELPCVYEEENAFTEKVRNPARGEVK